MSECCVTTDVDGVNEWMVVVGIVAELVDVVDTVVLVVCGVVLVDCVVVVNSISHISPAKSTEQLHTNPFHISMQTPPF